MSIEKVGAAAQSAAVKYWTEQKMRAASPEDQSGLPTDSSLQPLGTPSGMPFDGVPSVGTFFYTVGSVSHHCTVSVVKSPTKNLGVTAAHCIYGDGAYRRNLVFVPGYTNSQQPHGVWPVQSLLVAEGWKQSADINLDFGFITVAADQNTGKRLEEVTGGNIFSVGRNYDNDIKVIGYPGSSQQPIQCATHSTKAMHRQLQFDCGGYVDGTSGSPLVKNYDSQSNTGSVIGVIGGYQEGGKYDWRSYSSRFGRAALRLYIQAEREQLGPRYDFNGWWKEEAAKA